MIVSGKRKTAVAKANIIDGTGKVYFNRNQIETLSFLRKLRIQEPLRITEQVLGKVKYDIHVNVKGGGNESQIEAARLAIAKALVAVTKSNELRRAFVSYDRNLLVADTRRKEAYKPNDSKARSKRQKSYR